MSDHKQCTKCKKSLHINNFYNYSGYKNGKDSICKTCRADRAREYNRNKTFSKSTNEPIDKDFLNWNEDALYC